VFCFGICSSLGSTLAFALFLFSSSCDRIFPTEQTKVIFCPKVYGGNWICKVLNTIKLFE